VDKLGPYLQERNISILNEAQNLWALADSDGGLNLDSLGSHTLQVGENPPPRPRAAAAAKAAKVAKEDDAEVLPVSFKGNRVRDSGRVEVLEETNLGDGNEAEDVGSGDGDDGAALAATSSEDAITRALTRRLHEYLRAGTNGISSKRAVYNSAVLTHLAIPTHDWDPTSSQAIRIGRKHAGEYIDCDKGCDAISTFAMLLTFARCRHVGANGAVEVGARSCCCIPPKDVRRGTGERKGGHF
jgi:hypothetical protein